MRSASCANVAVSRRTMLKAAVATTVFAGFSLSPFAHLPAQSGGRPRGLALCIGLNHVSPASYGGWSGILSGCVADARDMKAIADGTGTFTKSLLLLNEQATLSAVKEHIAWAAYNLKPGETFMISCSSHGSFCIDQDGDETDDHRDETWCLFDGQWIDDDRYQLFQQFAPGVKILMVADMCHSGTTERFAQASLSLENARNESQRNDELRQRSRSVPSGNDKAIDAGRQVLLGQSKAAVEKAGAYAKRIKEAANREAPNSMSFGERFNVMSEDKIHVLPSPIRAMPEALAISLSESVAPAKSRSSPTAERDLGVAGILLAACQDRQTALDGPGNGVFTFALKSAWNGGAFQGDYDALFQAVRSQLRDYPDHQPNLRTFGLGADTIRRQRPFNVV